VQADRPFRVLIADDSRLFRHALVRSLSSLGNVEVVGIAATGREAVDGVAKLEPDLLMLDLNMPDGDGFFVLRTLREGIAAPLVFVLSFAAVGQAAEACLRLGAHGVFDKAENPAPLFDLLHQLSTAAIDPQTLRDAAASRFRRKLSQKTSI
jgi:DNA-binding NarL/FixJ family response regulator